jgi:hypothetical protein
LKVGWGQNNDNLGLLELPRSMDCGEHIEDLIQSIYFDINQLNPHNNNDEFFQHRTILSAHNADVDAVNAQILHEMQGDIHTLQDSDMMVKEDGADQPVGTQYPAEYFNSFNASGVPSAKF